VLALPIGEGPEAQALGLGFRGKKDGGDDAYDGDKRKI
jgi:hypothetical protein